MSFLFLFFCRILSRYYQCQRQADLRNAARTTIRLLESLIRLAQAHARLMFREFVTVQDALVAVTCVECSMQNSALLGSMNALHTRFPDDPQEEYSRQAALVLKRLNLEDVISVIDEEPSTDDRCNVSQSGNNIENNIRTPNESLPNDNVSDNGLRSRVGKGQTSSIDEESDAVVNNDNNGCVSSDFDEDNSLGQLTGVFPISSSEVGNEGFVEEDSSHTSAAPSICKTPGQHKQTNGVDKLESSKREEAGNDDDFSKPSRFPTGLRAIPGSKEQDSLKTENHKAIASISLEKSKKIIEMFAKKPQNAGSAAIQISNCQTPQVDSSRIFMTEELSDQELEMEWPSEVISSLQTESNVNHTIGLLRGRERTV